MVQTTNCINNSVRARVVGPCENIGITYSGGTFSITSGDGSALSAGNPGYVSVPSVNLPGQVLTFKITANQSFKDNASGSSQIAGNTFGVSIASGAYNQDLPFFIYAVLNSAQLGAGNAETTLTFMISRMPNVMTTLAAGTIAHLGTGNADTQGSFFALASITDANYANSACISIGSFRMRSTSSLADWTVQTLNFNDGIGRFQENNVFIVPTGAFGAATSSFFYSNGGTAPQLTGLPFRYSVTRDNKLVINQDAFGAPTVNGAGAGALQLAAPYNFGGYIVGSGYAISGANTPNATNLVVLVGDRTGTHLNAIEMYYINGGLSFAAVPLSNIGVGAGLNDTLGYFAVIQIDSTL